MVTLIDFTHVVVTATIGVAALSALLWLHHDVVRARRYAVGLFDSGLLADHEVSAVDAAFAALSKARFRGAVLGALLWAGTTALIWHHWSLDLYAALTGAAAGVAVAQRWRVRRACARTLHLSELLSDLRSAVGWRLPLTFGTAAAAAVTTNLWILARGSSQAASTPNRQQGCNSITDTGTQQVTGIATVLLIGLLCSLSAVAVLRRAADASIPASADEALRQAGIRVVLGSSTAVSAILAGWSFIALGALVLVPCASQSRAATAGNVCLLGAGCGCFGLAIAALIRSVFFPCRVSASSEVASTR